MSSFKRAAVAAGTTMDELMQAAEALAIPEGKSTAVNPGAFSGDSWVLVRAEHANQLVFLSLVESGCLTAVDMCYPVPAPEAVAWLRVRGVDTSGLTFKLDTDGGPEPVNLYAIAGGGLVKIGRTAGPPERRLAALRTMSPVPLALVATSTEVPGRTEADVHAEFAAYRRHGEWFDLSPLMVDGRTISDLLRFEPVQASPSEPGGPSVEQPWPGDAPGAGRSEVSADPAPRRLAPVTSRMEVVR